MQLTPTTDAAAPRPDGHGIDTVASRLQAATTQLSTIAQELAHHEREWRERRSRLKLDGHQRNERMAQEAKAASDPLAVAEAAVAALAELRDRRQTRVAEAAVRLRRRLRTDLERCIAAAEEQANVARHELARRHPPAAAEELGRRQAAVLAEIDALKARVARLDTELLRCTRLAGPVVEATAAPPVPTSGNVDRQLAALRDAVEKAEALGARITGGAAHGNSRLGGVLFNHGLIALPHLMAGVLLPLVQLGPYVPWVAVSAIATQGLVPFFTRGQRRRLGQQLGELRSALRPLAERLMQVAYAARQELDPQGPLQQRLDRVVEADAGLATALERLRASTAQALNRARQREQRLRERLTANFTRDAAALRQEAATAAAELQARLAGELAQAHAALEDGLAAGDRELAAKRAQLVARWQEGLAALRAYADGLSRRGAELHPAWPTAGQPSAAWDAWTPATTFPGEIPVGSARLPLAALVAACGGQALAALAPTTDDAPLEVPVALAFPSPASLLVRAGPDGRAAALRLVNQTVLRALAAFPAGRLRLTLIDPVGLGEAFAGLLDLADHEDSLLGRGVLNEAGAIEQGLADLIAHMEMVIQKHLRGRYATIEDYNREAGEMQEALHLVVVADFPAGFGERALERLMVLARSGARCGVHLVLLHDDRRTLPAALDLAWFRRTGIVLRDIQGRLVLDREELHDWEFHAQPMPPAELAARLVATVGREAQHGQRVQVPFAAVAPGDDALWKLSSASGLRVPLGKRGADRLQYLDLGRGTAQHVLVGGRTGSGKSTLFHVLITSAALWYHPREVEFHLIDFKKGVEFKAFATHRLPHARVIAIESDREFGLSVLRNLDQELARRGDAFRKVGAQDLAAHRAAPGGAHLPRIVLLIDEFQEFFTEDDAIARDAALLLDRFVRQGRAFGLHVVLGSQTLGGSYSLAKSSLGQMGVRIVLPCNEADAHLLLHEDNDATRLLSRPGDAIYNDHAGMAEGNSPFQVCWLSDEQEQGQLRRIAARTAADGWRPARPAVVFEGNGPAHLEDDADLAALLAAPPAMAGSAQPRAGIGQSSSLKGTAEVAFPAAAGGNLLIIGQNREAAAATCGALMLGLAARRPPGALRLLALDGEDREGPFAHLCARLAGCLPHQPVRHEVRGLNALLGELDTLLEQRQSGADPGTVPVLLTVFALQRIRQLRPDDDISFDRGEAGGPPPAERFARILANGPEYGIHTVVWCDSLASVQRGLGRRALRDFDARILFQMSAGDSTELIDDDGASRLGLHTALLVEQGEGRREKFRPYSLPDPAFIDRVGAALRGPA